MSRSDALASILVWAQAEMNAQTAQSLLELMRSLNETQAVFAKPLTGKNKSSDERNKATT